MNRKFNLGEQEELFQRGGGFEISLKYPFTYKW